MPLVIDTPESLKPLVGHELALTDWMPVSQERIRQFAEATGDLQWIHLDRERAQRESPFGATIAHGFLTLSLLSFFMKQALKIEDGPRMTINYGLNRVRFPSPLPADANVRARFTLQSCKDVPGGAEAVFAVVVEQQNQEKPCCVAEWIIRYYN
jgi:acyl dehydratase